MKILMINTIQYNINGIAEVIVQLSISLSKNKNNKIYLTNYGYLDKKYVDLCKLQGIEFLPLPPRKKIFKYKKALINYIKKLNIDIAHIHGNSSTMLLETFGLRKYCKVVAHNHNTTSSHSLANTLLKIPFNQTIDLAIACSNEAGEYVYKKSFLTLNNPVDFYKYKYNQVFRSEIRNKYNVNDKIVLLHVGVFNKQKNQQFLIELMSKLDKDKYALFLVGEGETKNQIIETSKNMKNVIFVDNTSEINKYYSGADVFLFPSLFESFGLVLLEAQMSGLKCIASNLISRSSQATTNVKYISLSVEDRKNEIVNLNMKFDRSLKPLQFEKFNVDTLSNTLFEYYLSLL